MDIKEIRRLIRLVESSAIEELEIKEEDYQIRITKGKAILAAQTQIPVAVPPLSTVPSPIQFETAVKEAKIEAAPGKAENVIEICSPMVGTFYRAPAPDVAPYVDTGSVINPGKVLCVIEAMKLMNEIEAEISGKIVMILAENAQPVEYNQPLFMVEKL
ncbi:MAG: acetyl-CoA carboxylase biotin carboxyl carrier protein [bacterium]